MVYDNLNLPQSVSRSSLSVQDIEWSCSGNEPGLSSDSLKGPIFAEVGKGCQNQKHICIIKVFAIKNWILFFHLLPRDKMVEISFIPFLLHVVTAYV